MDEDEEQEIVKLMRRAHEESRGYATYWEWAPDGSVAEVGVAQALTRYLAGREGIQWAIIKPISDDPPDVLAISKDGCRIGIEVTEIVDEATTARHRYHKKLGQALAYDWAAWDEDIIARRLKNIIDNKDVKLSSISREFDFCYLAIMTDEPNIGIDMASSAISKISAECKNIDRAFLLLSYMPGVDENFFPDGIPVVEIPVSKLC